MWPEPIDSWRSFFAPDHVHRVVGMDQADGNAAAHLVEVVEEVVHAAVCRKIVAGGEEVAGVDADAEAWVVVEPVQVLVELIEG